MRFILVISALTACGGGSSGGGDVTPFIGVYSVTSHTRAESAGGGTTVGCAATAPAVTNGMAFFKLDVDTFFMDSNLLRLSECSDAAGMTCMDTLVSMRAGGPGLVSESSNTQTGGGTACQLYYEHDQASLSGATVSIEALEKYDAPNLSSADCTLDKAQALASSPDCRSVERWVGTQQ
jgi:hypothetical protein